MGFARFGKQRGLSLVVLLMFSAVLILCSPNTAVALEPNETHQADSLWIEPSATSVQAAGEKFNLTVWLNITDECFAWQLKILFNSTYCDVSRVGYTNGEKSDFFSDHTTITIAPIIESSQGYVIAGETLLENNTRTSGYGSLIWIEFSMKTLPTEEQFGISFSMPYGVDTFVLDSYLDTIAVEHIDGAAISIFHPQDNLVRDLVIVAIIIGVLILVAIGIVKRRRVKPDE